MFFKHMDLGNSLNSLQMFFNFKMTVCHSCNLRQMRDAEYLMMLSDHCHLFRDFLCSSSTDIQYLISTNPGETLKPLGQIVSGGELSRIMLAIKAILADRDEIETLIFDEIDTGISGRTAQKVSEKMAKFTSRKFKSFNP